MSRASPLWEGSAGACVCLCLSGMVGVAHSRAPRVGGNRGIMRNSNVSGGHGPAPMCAAPLIAHGSPTTAYDAHEKSPRSRQKPTPTPQSPRPPMCNIDDDRHPPGTLTTLRTEIGPIQPGRPDVDAPTTRSRAKATCRTSEPSTHSRPAAARPISTRSTTDLEPEADRSRYGLRPISAREGPGGSPGREVSAQPSLCGDEDQCP